jgi:hypothetical protein
MSLVMSFTFEPPVGTEPSWRCHLRLELPNYSEHQLDRVVISHFATEVDYLGAGRYRLTVYDGIMESPEDYFFVTLDLSGLPGEIIYIYDHPDADFWFFYSITSAEYNRLFGETPQGEPDGRHPFAIALEEFFADASGETVAYFIENVPEVDGGAVFARKRVADRNWSEAYDVQVFHMHNGRLRIHEDEDIPYMFSVLFSESGHLVHRWTGTRESTYMIHSIIGGELVFIDEIFTGGWDNDKAAQYGLSHVRPSLWTPDRPDDTEMILAMTTR